MLANKPFNANSRTFKKVPLKFAAVSVSFYSPIQRLFNSIEKLLLIIFDINTELDNMSRSFFFLRRKVFIAHQISS